MVEKEQAKLREISSLEFVRRIRSDCDIEDKSYALFLGAGCSVSSGIPDAASLTKKWMRELFEKRKTGEMEFKEWSSREFPDYDENNAASHYGKLIEENFHSLGDRQREIEKICSRKYPGFGYAVLSDLISKKKQKFNVVLTTNFDDLVADALYVYQGSRPLVISHESLAGFIRPTFTRPIIVKIHGDYHLAPLNIDKEINNIDATFIRTVQALIQDRGLIFIGYGGNDDSIKLLMENLPLHAMQFPIYWVSPRYPNCSLSKFLITKKAIWVKNNDFDELMVLVKDIFKVEHPDEKLWQVVFSKYFSVYEELSKGIKTSRLQSEEGKALKDAIERSDEELPGPYLYLSSATKKEKTNSQEAEKIYLKGIKKYPESVPLLGNYANFLYEIRKDYEGAEQYYQKAIEVDQTSATNLGNYAIFLENIRKDYEGAEQYYQKALEVDQTSATNLGNYAIFLEKIRKDYEGAEQYYQKALEVDPTSATNLGNYANFLKNIRKDYEGAEQYYQKALEVDQTSATNLGNYANFLYEIRKDYEGAEQYYQKALEVDQTSATNLGNYAIFLEKIRKDYEGAEQYYQKALEVDPTSATNLGNYANFLKNIRKDYEGAEQYYQKALEVDPTSATNLGSYANFLYEIRKDYEGAEQYYQKALEVDQTSATNLGNYAGFLLGMNKIEKGTQYITKDFSLIKEEGINIGQLSLELWFYAYLHQIVKPINESLKEIKMLLMKDVRSAGWDFTLNMSIAEKQNHPDMEWIQKLSDVIIDNKPYKILNSWEKWKNI